MTKADLIGKIAEKAGLNKADAEKATNTLVESITFQGFGTFKVKDRAARKARNSRTGEEINVPASKSASFSPANILKKL